MKKTIVKHRKKTVKKIQKPENKEIIIHELTQLEIISNYKQEYDKTKIEIKNKDKDFISIFISIRLSKSKTDLKDIILSNSFVVNKKDSLESVLKKMKKAEKRIAGIASYCITINKIKKNKTKKDKNEN